MLRYFYQICLVIFLGQSVFLPLLIVWAGWLWSKQNRRLEALKKELGHERRLEKDAGKTIDGILAQLPQLQPLNCAACGAALLLQESETRCPNCEARGPLPSDYAAALSLKPQLTHLTRTALRYWHAANSLTWPPVAWLFFLLIFAEPLIIFPTVIIGSNLYPDTWFDQAFKAAGENLTFLIMLPAFFGFIIWMIVFIFLNSLSKSLRQKLPVMPRVAGNSQARQTANCQSCGGGIEYEARSFACICDYCRVENFRIQFARRERRQTEKQSTRTKSLLFAAMEIVDDFTGTFFLVMAILVGAAVLLTAFYTIKNL